MAIGDAGDGPVNRDAVDVNVEHRKEDRNAPTCNRAEAKFSRGQGLHHRYNSAIGGSQHGICTRRRHSFRIAEEVKAEQQKNGGNPGEPIGNREAQHKCHGAAGQERPGRWVGRRKNHTKRSNERHAGVQLAGPSGAAGQNSNISVKTRPSGNFGRRFAVWHCQDLAWINQVGILDAFLVSLIDHCVAGATPVGAPGE